MAMGALRQREFHQDRLSVLWIFYYCGFCALALRLLQIQVIQNVYYTQVAERNRIQPIYQAAPRGRIYDRDGNDIAKNRPAFSLIYLPGKKEDQSYLPGLAASLAHELPLTQEQILDLLRSAQKDQNAEHLAENLPLKTMFRLSEIKSVYRGIDLIVEARRHYPNGAFAGHLLGYMGKMDPSSWKELKNRGYHLDSWIGKTGLEGLFEAELRGTDGEVRMEVDAHGRLKRILDQAPWKPGSNIQLTISSRVQKAVEDGLRASPSGSGGAVVLDPRNGDVLALASVPDFDPNLFLLAQGDEAKAQLKHLPEFNLALSGTFAPGSTFKIITSAALLEEGKVSPEEKVFCPGKFLLGDRIFKCWEKKGHKYQDFIHGVTNSCDVYFYQMGLRVGGAAIEKYEKLFHLGEKTRIALLGEKSGGRFGPESRGMKNKGWYDGDTLNLSIGQGELLVTPIQMAMVIAAVANRGTLWRPHFTRKIEYSDGRATYEQKPEALGQIDLQPRTWDMLQKALVNVIKEGTGRGVDIPGLVVAGKTGTAQNPHGEDHAWFVAYAGRPGEEPSVAVSVLVQMGGHGASAAGPVARKAIEAAFLGNETRPSEAASARKTPPEEESLADAVREPARRSPPRRPRQDEAEAPLFPILHR